MPDLFSTRTISDQQRSNFAANVRRNAFGNQHSRTTRDALIGWTRESTIVLTAEMWAQYEPSRRTRVRYFRKYALTSMAASLVTSLFWLVFTFSYPGAKLPDWLTLLQFITQLNIFVGCLLVRNRVEAPEQRGCLPLLVALKDVRLTPAMVDALDWFDMTLLTGYRPALRLALIDLLPQYAQSEAPPLNRYQRNILRREVQRQMRRLRRPSANVTDSEAEFVVVAVRYLAEYAKAPALPLVEAEQETYVTLLQKFTSLPTVPTEPSNRRFVREAVRECLVLQQTGRQ